MFSAVSEARKPCPGAPSSRDFSQRDRASAIAQLVHDVRELTRQQAELGKVQSGKLLEEQIREADNYARAWELE